MKPWNSELARQLDELDPMWFDHFLSTEQAARFYGLEIVRKPSLLVHSSPFEPATYVDLPYEDPDEEAA